MIWLLLACKAPDPAPTEVNGLSRFLLTEYEAGEDDVLLEASANLVALYDETVGEGDLVGTLEDPTAEDLAALGMPEGTDPSRVVGVFHLTPQACTLEQLDGIFTHPNQEELFESTYESYQRTYLDDVAAYKAGELDVARWDIDITASFFLGVELVYTLESGLRRLNASEEDAELSTALLSRTVLPEAATTDGKAYFDQSYQAEYFVPYGDEVLHLYALWNSGGAEGLEDYENFWLEQYTDEVVAWDARIDELCAQPELWE